MTPTTHGVRKAHEVAQTLLAPIARDADRDGRLPDHVIPALGDAGLIGMRLEREHEGGGASTLAQCLAAEAIGAVDGSVRGFLAVQSGLVLAPLAHFARDDVRDPWLGPLREGRAIGAFALTEPGAGSDVGAIATRIEDDGDHVRITGTKWWITNGGIADVILVFGSVDPSARTKGLACYAVPADAEGLTREAMPGHELGHRASDHAILQFDGVRVPKAHRLGGERDGFRVAMAGLAEGRLHVAAGAVGIQQGCMDACIDIARSRRQFGKRIGDLQQVGAELADMHVRVETSRLLVHHAARLRDQGQPAAAEVAAAKLHATEAALDTTRAAIQVHGARGYTDAYPIERHYRDAIALTIYEGTSHVQRVILARQLLGKDRGGPSTNDKTTDTQNANDKATT